MDKETRNSIQRATQAARRLLEEAFRQQLEGTYDILLDGTVAEQPGSHLSERQRLTREKLAAAVAHKRSTGLNAREAVDAYLREAAFTTLNRFVALKMLEARKLVQECVSKGEASSGFRSEFTAVAPGLVAVEDKGYRLYLETLFDEIGQEVRVLFDRRDVSSLLWPNRQTLLELLGLLNAPELASVWSEDETIGWVFQYFNGDEERTKMRKESQAPRNSRELAVRNQFFTPRYVVQFLTDNTLGRTWYEMMLGETKLAQLDYLMRRPNEVFLAEGESAPESDLDDRELSQEELLQQTAHVPFRAKKDPRDLRMLDPACGSGHFLLYTFDLLLTIYEEAWGDAGAAAFTETGRQLRGDYESVEGLRRAMPELILRNNLHGVDIDPRAAQIAALALWLRAQRAYNQFEVDRAQRPPITKTNTVVAEPMPGDADLVDEFAASLKPTVLGDLFKKMVGEMKLAGELGSLLKIEESIAKAVKKAAEVNKEGNLFAGKIESQDFWDTADEQIVAALGSFAESAAGPGGIRRRLFAGDAVQGVAFIELMRKRYDAVLMNPPFGAATPRILPSVRRLYPKGYVDLCTAFVDRGVLLSEPGGLVGAITSRTAFFLARFKHWRHQTLFLNSQVDVAADFAHGVLDAMVETVAYTVRNDAVDGRRPFAFFDCRKGDSATALRVAQRSPDGQSWLVHSDVRASRASIPVHLSDRQSVAESVTTLAEVAPVNKGGGTGQDERFVRLAWEIPENCKERWRWLSKGGEYAPFYFSLHLRIDWLDDGNYLGQTLYLGRPREGLRWGRLSRTRSFQMRPGVFWSRRSQKGLSFRILPEGVVVSDKSPFAAVAEADLGFALLAYLNSGSVQRFAEGQTAFGSYELGVVGSVPLTLAERDRLTTLGSRAYSAAREMCSLLETDPGYRGLTPEMSSALRDGADVVSLARDYLRARLELLKNIVLEIDEITGKSHPLTAEERLSFFATVADEYAAANLASHLLFRVVGLEDCSTSAATSNDPFTALPLGPVAAPRGGVGHGSAVLVDDAGHDRDLIRCAQSVVGELHCHAVGAAIESGEGLSLREWYRRRFFAWHLGRFSASRRKAPVFWQLATPSASYSIWCYFHRLTRDSFFRIANEFVTPKVDHEERKLNTLRQEAGPDPSSKQLKEIDAQETFVAALRAFATEVKRIAPLWNPNLNDGVIINFAPLWRLVPQNKKWQGDCRKIWDKLVNGDYDWAHLAMYLWPERVVPKCRDDRSLAIAHGLEDEFWVEDEKGKWKKRQVSDERCTELVVERSSAAVKAALNELLSAPAPAGGRKRRKKAKSSRG